MLQRVQLDSHWEKGFSDVYIHDNFIFGHEYNTPNTKIKQIILFYYLLHITTAFKLI